jgi:hypothetical protein
MIQLDLKAKHYYLIAEILFGFAAYSSFATLEKIKTGCLGVADDDLVSVESDVNTITTVFQILSQKPEGSFNDVNTEMLDLLFPQIAAGVGAGDPEWIQLSNNVTEIRTNNLAVISASIENGKSRLYN